MKHDSFDRRRFITGLALAPLTLPLSQVVLAQPASPAVAPATLRIGFQKSAITLVILKQQGALEKRFPNTKVQWAEFPAGPQLLEALSVGSLDVGMTGDSPPVFAQAAGKALVYFGAEPPKPLSSALLVPAGSKLSTLAELRGKRIALQKGSSAHYLLLRAVDKAGLKWADITPVYLAPAEARAAFERGAVDAWAIWDPFYAATELAIRPRVLATGQGLSNNNSFYLAATPFAEQQPKALLALLDELTRADVYVQNNRKEAAQRVADFSGLSLAVVHLFMSRRPASPVALLTPAIVADQQRVADAFFREGLIPRRVRVAEIVWRPEARDAAKQVLNQAAGQFAAR